jgi:hypothetical protein
MSRLPSVTVPFATARQSLTTSLSSSRSLTPLALPELAPWRLAPRHLWRSTGLSRLHRAGPSASLDKSSDYAVVKYGAEYSRDGDPCQEDPGGATCGRPAKGGAAAGGATTGGATTGGGTIRCTPPRPHRDQRSGTGRKTATRRPRLGRSCFGSWAKGDAGVRMARRGIPQLWHLNASVLTSWPHSEQRTDAGRSAADA